MATIKRPLAKAAGIGKGIAKGLAGFYDFKKSFEDAVRKNKWQKERDELEIKEKRQQAAFTAGYRPAEGQMGQWLAGGNVPMEMSEAMQIPGLIRLPNGSYRTDPNFKKQPNLTPNQAINILSDNFKRVTFKKYYPDMYEELEKMLKSIFPNIADKVLSGGEVGVGGTADLMDTDW